MALTTRQTAELARIEEEIADIESRFKVSHGLGDTHTAQGMTTQFIGQEYWDRKLSTLRRRRDQLEDIRDGNPVSQPGVTASDFYPG